MHVIHMCTHIYTQARAVDNCLPAFHLHRMWTSIPWGNRLTSSMHFTEITKQLLDSKQLLLFALTRSEKGELERVFSPL